MATLYFSDGRFLYPVSRRIQTGDNLPRAALAALLAGPPLNSGLINFIPSGVKIRSVNLDRDVARIDLSGAFPEDVENAHLAEMAIVETITELPGVAAVALGVEGKPLTTRAQRRRLLYYASANGLVAVPSVATSPNAAVAAFLAGPPDRQLTGLPTDVRLLHYNYNRRERAASLDLSYTPSVHELALEQPERMRFVLLGLIASLTEFQDIETVRLDFEGKTRLGVGQCSDLLRTAQRRPVLFNDERLLGR